MLSVEEALTQLLEQAEPTRQVETVPLASASGRVLAGEVRSLVDVPPHDNSGLDGYAIRTADLATDGPTRLHVTQRIPAGQTGEPLSPGTAARIFTGAPVPEGADAIVAQENTRRENDHVIFNHRPAAGEDIRPRGGDISRNQVVLETGRRLRPQEIGAAASVGVTELSVYRPLRVATFTTGDELVEPGHPLKPGQIYNSNHAMIVALLQGLGVRVLDLGRVEDRLEATAEALSEAAEGADLVITSGGVSVGEEDHVRRAVEQLGSLDLWRVRMKPGKPLAFGHAKGTPFIGLPGNPVSAFATFCLFARPFILRSQGVLDARPLTVSVPAGFERQPGERREFLRARLDEKGRATLYPNQNSGVLSSTAWATGFAVAREERAIARGDMVDFISLSELLD